MSTIVTRAGKGSPLTWNEVDNNFTNLNTDKLQSGNTAAALTITSATINGGTITGTALNGTLGATTPSTAVVTSLTDSALTSGRVTYASTGGLLADSASLTYDGTTLTSTKFAGALNGSLGATTPSTVVATDLTTTGNTILGNASTDTLNVASGTLITDGLGKVGIGTTAPQFNLTVSQQGTGVTSYVGIRAGEGGSGSTSNQAVLYYRIRGGGPGDVDASITSSYVDATAAYSLTYDVNNTHRFVTAGTERMRVGAGVSIGNTTDPGAGILSVTPAAGTIGGIKLQGANTDYQGISLYYAASGADSRSRAWQIAPNYVNFARLDFLTSSSSTTNPTTSKGYIDGTTGAYVAVSDLRAKKNIEDCFYGLTEVMAMRPVIYNMIEEEDGADKHLGFIAQEIKKVVNEAVSSTSTEEELYGLDKAGLIPILVKAIQELKAEIDMIKGAK